MLSLGASRAVSSRAVSSRAVSNRVAIAAGVVIVGAGLAAGAPAAAGAPGSTVHFAALGDSYAAGVGAGTERTTCRTTSGAYAAMWSITEPQSTQLSLAACSGATSSDVVDHQLQALDADTDLVSLTVGSNDLGLTDAVRVCAGAEQSAKCVAALKTIQADLAKKLPAGIETLLAAIKQKAANAKVAVVGYPLPFVEVPDCPAFPATKSLRDAGNAAVTGLNAVLEAQARKAGAEFVTVAAPFAAHRLCGASPWLVGLEGLNAQTTLHPTLEGQQQGYLPAFSQAVGSVDDMQAWIAERDGPAAASDDAPAGSGGWAGLSATGWWLIGLSAVLVVMGTLGVVFVRRKASRATADR